MARAAWPKASPGEEERPIYTLNPAEKCDILLVSENFGTGHTRGGGGNSPRDSVSGCGCERSSGRNRAGASSPDEPAIGGIVSGNHSENSLSLANLLRLASGKVVSPFVAILYPLCPVYPFGGTDHSASAAASRFDPSLRSLRCGPAEGTGMGLQAVYGHHGLLPPTVPGPIRKRTGTWYRRIRCGRN